MRLPGRDFEVRVALEGDAVVRVEVSDTRADTRPPEVRRRLRTRRSRGGGLRIVEALSTRWGVLEGTEPLKTVWAEVSALWGGA